jgi:hypothetical protein
VEGRGGAGQVVRRGNHGCTRGRLPVSPKLAELAARARKEGRLTNVVQFVDEELLRLAFRSLRSRPRRAWTGNATRTMRQTWTTT